MIKYIDNEKYLLTRIAEGDEKSFGILFNHYSLRLQAFALKFTKSVEVAEEIIQNTFLKIWLNREKVEQVENIKAYLYKYVSNECLSYLRNVLREGKHLEEYAQQQEGLSNHTLDSIKLNDVARMVATAVDKLPVQRRKIYELSRGEGKSIPEIAAILGISPNTVKNALVTSLKSIREYLTKQGYIFEISLLLSFLYEIFSR